MSVHSAHPPSLTHGLADDCPRCAEHAAEPFTALDDDHLRAFYVHAVLVEYGSAEYRSATDAKVGQRMLDAAAVATRMRRLGLI